MIRCHGPRSDFFGKGNREDQQYASRTHECDRRSECDELFCRPNGKNVGPMTTDPIHLFDPRFVIEHRRTTNVFKPMRAARGLFRLGRASRALSDAGFMSPELVACWVGWAKW